MTGAVQGCHVRIMHGETTGLLAHLLTYSILNILKVNYIFLLFEYSNLETDSKTQTNLRFSL